MPELLRLDLMRRKEENAVSNEERRLTNANTTNRTTDKRNGTSGKTDATASDLTSTTTNSIIGIVEEVEGSEEGIVEIEDEWSLIAVCNWSERPKIPDVTLRQTNMLAKDIQESHFSSISSPLPSSSPSQVKNPEILHILDFWTGEYSYRVLHHQSRTNDSEKGEGVIKMENESWFVRHTNNHSIGYD